MENYEDIELNHFKIENNKLKAINMKKAQEYIIALAKSLNTVVIQEKDMHGMMYVEYEPPIIEGPFLDQPNTERHPDIHSRILTLLHELGHVYHGHTQGRPPYSNKTYYFDHGVLRSEAEAWRYAIKYFCLANMFGDISKIARDHMLR